MIVLSCRGDTVHELMRAIDSERRPDAPGNHDRLSYEASDMVESYAPSGSSVRVHYTRKGRHAVYPDDLNRNTVPDFVESVEQAYTEALTFYTQTLGFNPPLKDSLAPPDGGDERIDVYLLDFDGIGDGRFRTDGCLPKTEQCTGFFVQENDFEGYHYPTRETGIRIVSSHELFHGIQAAYDSGQGSVLNEATAVWATEMFDPRLDDFEGFVADFLAHPDRPIDHGRSDGADPFSYGAALFFKFLGERYHPEVIRELWAGCRSTGPANPYWLDVLDALLTARYDSSLSQALLDFSVWNLRLGVRADPQQSYRGGARYPSVSVAEHLGLSVYENIEVFHASTDYHRVPAVEHTTLQVTVDSEGVSSGLSEAHLVVVREKNLQVAPPQVFALPFRGTVPTDGADAVIFALVNTAKRGAPIPLSLCIGAAAECARLPRRRRNSSRAALGCAQARWAWGPLGLLVAAFFFRRLRPWPRRPSRAN